MFKEILEGAHKEAWSRDLDENADLVEVSERTQTTLLTLDGSKFKTVLNGFKEAVPEFEVVLDSLQCPPEPAWLVEQQETVAKAEVTRKELMLAFLFATKKDAAQADELKQAVDKEYKDGVKKKNWMKLHAAIRGLADKARMKLPLQNNKRKKNPVAAAPRPSAVAG